MRSLRCCDKDPFGVFVYQTAYTTPHFNCEKNCWYSLDKKRLTVSSYEEWQRKV